MNYNLFLDDVRTPSAAFNYTNNEIFNEWDWVVVKNHKEFVEYITEHGMPLFVSFDHDLADIHYDPTTQKESFEYHETTGLDCAKWLVDYCIDNNSDFPNHFVHSANPVGADNIDSYIKSYKNAKERGLFNDPL